MATNELPEQAWGLWERSNAATPPPSPTPDEIWEFAGANRQGGTARVYYGEGHKGLQRPVILSDGFNSGPSNFDALWHELDGKDYGFARELRRRGYDLVLLGYAERSASILHNATIAWECIVRTIGQRAGSAPLMVGGFSMGGIITRYVLAKMEHEGLDHQTSVYLSFDSPHRGAWIPISLQALAHFITAAPAMSRQINSPAARQLLWRHIASVDDFPKEDPLRTELLAELSRVGSWPHRPIKLGVANGRGDGRGNGVPAAQVALECKAGLFKPTTLRTQTPDNRVVLAHLKGPRQEKEIRNRELPEVDGAAGGKLEAFGIAAANLTIPPFSEAVAYHPASCFVPSISAVSIRDISEQNLKANIQQLDPDTSDFDEFICSSDNVLHSKMTPQLGMWIFEHMPR